MSGLVGSCGNMGGIIFTLILRFQPDVGRGFWIIGIISMAVNFLLFSIPIPAW